MDLKILSFNKTLFKKEFNTVKFLILFVAGMIFATTTIYVISRAYTFNNLEDYYIENNMENEFETNRSRFIEDYKEDINRRLGNGGRIINILIYMPIALIALLFSEEKRKKTFEILKVMPYTKYEIFFNKVLVALISIALPFIINGLMMILAWGLSSKLRMFYSLGQILKWLLLFSYYQLPVLGFALVFTTLTGTTVSYIVLTIIFLIFPIGITTLIYWNLAELRLIPAAIFFEDILINIIDYTPIGVLSNQGIKAYTMYVLGSIGMIVLAKTLFDKNKVERSGETLEFENTEGFFKYGVAICTALLVGMIFSWIFNDYIMYLHSLSHIVTILVTFIGYIVGGVLGYLAANLSIKVNRSKA